MKYSLIDKKDYNIGVKKKKDDETYENALKRLEKTVQTPNTGETVRYSDPQGVLKAGMENKAPAKELLPVWNDYKDSVSEKVKSGTSVPEDVYNETYKDWRSYLGQQEDISEQILSAIQRGADPEEVRWLNQKRVRKATENPYLSEYAYDDVYKSAVDYINNNQKGYRGKYSDEVDRTIKNRGEKFKYDVADDPLYRQYLRQAREQGGMAVDDTLARVASGAGGMNSYAVSAAQGVNNNYMQKVNDVIPELYQIAYNKYLDEQNKKLEDINIMTSVDNDRYNKWAAERDREDNLRDTAYDRVINDEDRKYQKEVYDEELKREEEKNAAELDAKKRSEAEERALNYISLTGELPPQRIIDESGQDINYYKGMADAVKKSMMQQAVKASSGGGSGSSSGGNAKSSGGTSYGDYTEYDNLLKAFGDESNRGPREFAKTYLKPIYEGKEQTTEEEMKSLILENTEAYNIDVDEAKAIMEVFDYDTTWLNNYQDRTGNDKYKGMKKKNK